MSTLDLIRTLRRALNRVRDAHDRRAVTEVARGLIGELNAHLGEVPVAALVELSDLPDETAFVNLDQIHRGGMAVCG